MSRAPPPGRQGGWDRPPSRSTSRGRGEPRLERRDSTQTDFNRTPKAECINVLGCDCQTELEDELDSVVQTKDRTCTDLPCLIIAIGIFVSLFALWAYAGDHGGDADKVLWAIDWTGAQCPDDTKGAWPDVRHPDVKVCVKDCAETMSNPNGWMVTPKDVTSSNAGYESTSIVGYCIPTEFYVETAVQDINLDLGNFGIDLWRAKWMVLLAMSFAIILSLIFMCAVNFLAAAMVWTFVVALVIGGGLGSGIMIYMSYGDGISENSGWALFIGGIILGGITILFLFFMCWIHKSIEIAVEILDQAGDALIQLCWVNFAAALELLFTISLLAIWAYVGLFLLSMNSEEETLTMPTDKYHTCANCQDLQANLNSATYQNWTWNKDFDWYVVYMTFVFFFIIFYLKYFWYLMISSAFAEWYFSAWASPDGDDWKERGSRPDFLSHWPTCQAFTRVFLFHQGTVAFAAFLLSVIGTIHAMFEWWHRRVMDAGNPCLRCLACCFRTVIITCECCIKYLSKTALNYCAIFGTPFCPSGRRAFSLLTRNMSKVAALTVINTYVTFIMKWAITIGSAGLAFFILGVWTTSVDINISEWSLVALWVAMIVLCHAATDVLIGTFDIGVDQIFMCFMVDNKVNSKGRMYASNDLLTLISDVEKKSQRLANKLQRQRDDLDGKSPDEPEVEMSRRGRSRGGQPDRGWAM